MGTTAWLLVLTYAVYLSSQQETDIKGSASFRQIGHFASKLSYGHIHTTFDFGFLKEEHKKLTSFLDEEIIKASSDSSLDKSREYFSLVRQQLEISTQEINRIDDLFFNEDSIHRQKRQIAGPLGLGLGLFGLGTSIYNLIEIRHLHSKLAAVEHREEFIAHELTAESNSIAILSDSIQTLKKVCKTVTSAFEIHKLKVNRLFVDTTMVTQHNLKLLEWGRGAEALLFGSIHPALVNTTLLTAALETLKKKAEKKGLRLLHAEKSASFKAPISFFTTKEDKFIVILHIPLVETAPIGIYEYLPIPTQIGNLVWTIDSHNSLLAMDKEGNQGLEMSQTDLFQCQVEKMHSGNLYLCPKANLIRNNIRNSCLGSLMVGNTEKIKRRCKHSVEPIDQDKEFAIQLSHDTIILNIKRGDSVHEVCANGTRTDLKKVGFTQLQVNPNCQIISDDYIFTPQAEIDLVSEFIIQPIIFKRSELFDDVEDHQLDQALKALDKIKPLDRKQLGEVRNFISTQDQDWTDTLFAYCLPVVSISICIAVVIIILIVYLRYKKNKLVENPPTP
jgi:hypothetical protein